MMCADMGHISAVIRRLHRLNVSMLHWDLMDAHFVPNMPCGLALLQHMRARTNMPFDVHLMVEDNDFFIRKVADIGVQMISVHVEATRHCDRALCAIRETGAKAGLALNPSTPLDVLEYVAELLDFVLIMTVNPGFSSQTLTCSSLRKIAECRAWLADRKLDVSVEVDGNVSFENIPKMIAAGADTLVVGSSSLFYPGASIAENMERVKAAIESGFQLPTSWGQTAVV